MGKITTLIIASFLSGCAGPVIKHGKIEYDYLMPSTYELTKKHKTIHVAIDDQSLKAPEHKLKYEALKLLYTGDQSKASMVVFVHLLPSYLVQRTPTTQQVVDYEESSIGQVVYVVMNRGYIRTPYSVELVDKVNDKLVFHTRGAENYTITAPPKPEQEASASELLKAFHANTQLARQAALGNIWEDLKGRYLNEITVSMGQMTFSLVSYHENEPVFSKAFELIKQNDQILAKRALALYNQAYKKYQGNEDEESKKILSYIDSGISAATKIVNDPHPQRYSR